MLHIRHDSTINIPSDATNVEITVASGKGGEQVVTTLEQGRSRWIMVEQGKFFYPDGARTLVYENWKSRANDGTSGKRKGGGSGGS